MSVKNTINTECVFIMTITQTTTKAVSEAASKQSLFHRICNKLGENNKPIFTVMAIACGKGTVRPILSITDKKRKAGCKKICRSKRIDDRIYRCSDYFVCRISC